MADTEVADSTMETKATEETAVEKVDEKTAEETKEPEAAEGEKKAEEEEKKVEEEEKKVEKEDGPTDPKVIESLRKQLELYFHDSNLRRDKFMRECIDNEEKNMEVKTFLTFNRVKMLTEKLQDLQDAVRASETLELSEDELKVRRKVPYAPAENEKEKAMARTVVVEGFPRKISIDICRSVFDEALGEGKVVFVEMRRMNGKFSGSVFVEFASEEDAKALLEKEGQLKCEESELKNFVMLNDWHAKMKAAVEEKNRKREEEEKKAEEAANVPAGSAIKVEGLGEECTWKMLKSEIGEEKVLHVNLNRKVHVAKIVLKNPDVAKETVALLETIEVEKIGGSKPSSIIVLEGEEFEKTVEEFKASLKKESSGQNRFNNNNNNKRSRGGNKGHGGKNNNKRSRKE